MERSTKVIAVLTAFSIYFYVKYRAISSRNTELENRVTSVLGMCSTVNDSYNRVLKERKNLESQVDQIRPNNPYEAAKLKMLIKQRNLKYGIGGNI